jgi:hypothetical protein
MGLCFRWRPPVTPRSSWAATFISSTARKSGKWGFNGLFTDELVVEGAVLKL